MTVDLFRLYRSIKQRHKRNPDDYLMMMNDDLGHALRQHFNGGELDLPKILKDLQKTEEILSPRKILVDDYLISQVAENLFTVDVPYQVQHRWREDASDVASVYIAKSSARPKEVKLGVTKMSLRRRERSYEYRYWYDLNIVWSKKFPAPFSAETRIKEAIKPHLVKAVTDGDSNEWYDLTVDDLRKVIESNFSLSGLDSD